MDGATLSHSPLAIVHAPNTIAVKSVQVPQADLLSRVVEMVRARMMSGCAFGVAGFDHPRDRAFYTRAAAILRLLDDQNLPTLLGRRVAHAPPAEANALLGLAFDRCDVGAAWMAWAGARSRAELCASTAEAFLRDRTTLAASTVERRAMTLRSWLDCLHGLP